MVFIHRDGVPLVARCNSVDISAGSSQISRVHQLGRARRGKRIQLRNKGLAHGTRRSGLNCGAIGRSDREVGRIGIAREIDVEGGVNRNAGADVIYLTSKIAGVGYASA